MSSDHTKAVSRSALSFLSGTMVSRFTGLLRDMVMAFCFGSDAYLAAFMVAFRLSNLMRRLFGEGSVSSGFIPHFESLRKSSQEKGALFFRDFFHSLSLFLFFLIALLEGILVCFYQWGHLEPDNKEILYLTMLMLPGILFICLYALGSALLQCEKKFFLVGIAPVAFNIIWIAAAFLLRNETPMHAMQGLSIAVVLAFLMQWAMTAPKTFAFLREMLSFKDCFRAKLFSKEIMSVVKPLFLSILGVGAVQINSALDSLFARHASLEGPAFLWYAIRIEQLPLALFGIALASALLPPLSRAMENEEKSRFLQLLQFAFHRTFSLILPCTLGILVCGSAGVNLLYGRGDFDMAATLETLKCLWGYGAGLLPSVFVLLLAPAFYAQKNYATPMRASLLSVLFNVVLNTVLVFGLKWGAFSIALSTSFAAFFNCLFLAHFLKKKVEGSLFSKELLISFGKMVVCTSLAAFGTLLIGHFLVKDPTLMILLGENPVFTREIATQLTQCFVVGFSFIAQLLAYAYLVGSADILQLVGLRKSVEQKEQP